MTKQDEIRTIRTVVDEIRAELYRVQAWVNSAETEDALTERREKQSAIRAELVECLLWTIEGEKPITDFVPASWAGIAHGMSYAAIRHTVKQDGMPLGDYLPSWSVHT